MGYTRNGQGMSMSDIVISEFMDEASVAALSAEFDVLYDKQLQQDAPRLLREAAACKALIVRNKTQVRGALLDGARHMRVVGRLGVGLDNIDTEACKARSITVITATGANSVSVAEYVLATMLMLVRGAYQSSHEVAAGAWPRERMVGGELLGKTLGLVGFGGIARDVAARARAFGMDIVAYDPFLPPDSPVWRQYAARPLPLDALLTEAHAVSLHIPLTDATRMLFDAPRIQTMRPGALLINTARGGIVDENALAEALKKGHLGGAAMDVFGNEPLPGDTPLSKAPHCILTPHIGGVTNESNVRVSSMVAQKVAQILKEDR